MHTREGTHTTPGSPAKAQPPGDLKHVQRDVRIRSKTLKINVILSFSCRSSPLPRTKNQYTSCAGFSFCAREGTSNKAAAHSAASKATVRLCLARGSQRLGMSTKKDAARLIRVGSFCFGGRYRTRTARHRRRRGNQSPSRALESPAFFRYNKTERRWAL